MNQTTQFLIAYGPLMIFGIVLLEQMGIPIPAMPLLLAAGALAAVGKFNLALGLSLTILACLVADTFWFYLGKFQGLRVLGLLCRISLEPDSCVRRTQNLFTRYGLPGVVVSKFVPGLSLVAPPLAGMSGTKYSRFIFVDAIGSSLYATTFMFIGYLFSNQMQKIASAISQIGGSALSWMVGLAGCYIAFKYWQRRKIRRELDIPRITVSELREKQRRGEKLVILDIRSDTEQNLDSALIPGAVAMALDEVESRQNEFERDHEVVIYCACPNEITSAKVAKMLQKRGFTRVRPLLGGIDAWKETEPALEFSASPET